MKDVKTLRLTVSYNWPIQTDKEAELFFTVQPAFQHVEMLASWGPGPRQQRAFTFQEPDLAELLEWLNKAMGYDDS